MGGDRKQKTEATSVPQVRYTVECGVEAGEQQEDSRYFEVRPSPVSGQFESRE